MKKILLLALIIIAATGCSKPGTVNGVVTYFYNEYQGDKPDIGATVYVTQADVTDIKDFLFARIKNEAILSKEALLDSYKSDIAEFTKLMKSPYATSEHKKTCQTTIDECETEIEKLQESLKNETKLSDEEFKALASDAYSQFLSIKTNNETVSTTVDGSGRYSIVLPKGEYTFVFISKGRQRMNVLEHGGQVITKYVKVESDSTQDVSVNFDL